MKIDVVVPDPARRWHGFLVERLAAEGHALGVQPVSEVNWPITMRAVLAMERRIVHRGDLAKSVHLTPIQDATDPELTIDLTGRPQAAPSALRVAFGGSFDDAPVATSLAAGRLVDIDVTLDGRSFERAAPMADNRTPVAGAADDIFARAITVLLKAVRRIAAGDRAAMPRIAQPEAGLFPLSYGASSLPRIAREAARRRTYRFAHWRVGYRLHDGPGVAQTGNLGTGWSVLPDDGTHFYADPFPFEHDRRRYIFVEAYPHATRKAIISVSEIDDRGVAQAPVPVLEAPHHLSYPQVFSRDGEIWMLPEGSSSGKLTLYRAERFSVCWVSAVLLVVGV